MQSIVEVFLCNILRAKFKIRFLKYKAPEKIVIYTFNIFFTAHISLTILQIATTCTILTV